MNTPDGRSYIRSIHDFGLGRENDNCVGPKTSNYGCDALLVKHMYRLAFSNSVSCLLFSS